MIMILVFIAFFGLKHRAGRGQVNCSRVHSTTHVAVGKLLKLIVPERGGNKPCSLPFSAQINPECFPRLSLKMCLIYWLDFNSKHDHFSDKIE